MRQIRFSIPMVFSNKNLPVGSCFDKEFDAQFEAFFNRAKSLAETIIGCNIPVTKEEASELIQGGNFQTSNKAKQDFDFTIDIHEESLSFADISLTSYDAKDAPFIIFADTVWATPGTTLSIPTFKTRKAVDKLKKNGLGNGIKNFLQGLKGALEEPIKEISKATETAKAIEQPKGLAPLIKQANLKSLIKEAEEEKLEKLCDSAFRAKNNLILSSLRHVSAFLNDLAFIQKFIKSYDKSLNELCSLLNLSPSEIKHILVGNYEMILLPALKKNVDFLRGFPVQNPPVEPKSPYPIQANGLYQSGNHTQTFASSGFTSPSSAETFKTTKSHWTISPQQIEMLTEAQRAGKKLEAHFGIEMVNALCSAPSWAIKACLEGSFNRFTSDKEISSVVKALSNLFEMYKGEMENLSRQKE